MNVIHPIFSLKLVCSERLIGRDGPTAWPAHSPDLNPLDFISGDIQRVLFILQKAMTFTTSKNGYIMDDRRFIRRLGFYSECERQCADVNLLCVEEKVGQF